MTVPLEVIALITALFVKPKSTPIAICSLIGVELSLIEFSYGICRKYFLPFLIRVGFNSLNPKNLNFLLELRLFVLNFISIHFLSYCI